MSRRLHVHYLKGKLIGIFDQHDKLVVDCQAGDMSEADALEVVNRWNRDEVLSVKQDRATFWQAVCIVLTVAYVAGFLEHLVKGCTA